MHKRLPIIIVGGGIGGLATALALAQKGINSLVLEQATHFREAGAGLLIAPNAFKMLDFLEVGEKAASVAFFPDNHIYMHLKTSNELMRMSLKIPVSLNSPEELQDRFKEALPDKRPIYQMLDKTKRWVVCDRDPTPHWTKGKAVLMGDAVHASQPFLTQGAGMTLEDAVILAHKIHLHRRDYPLAFKEFEKARFERTAKVQLSSRYYGDTANVLNSSPEEKYEW